MSEHRIIRVTANPLDAKHLSFLRSQLSDVLPSHFSEQPTPTLPIFECTLPEQHHDTFQTRVRKLGLIGREVTIQNYRCTPDAANPSRIELTTDIDLERDHAALASFVASHNGSVHETPDPTICLWENPTGRPLDDDACMALAERMAALRTDLDHTIQLGELNITSPRTQQA